MACLVYYKVIFRSYIYTLGPVVQEILSLLIKMECNVVENFLHSYYLPAHLAFLNSSRWLNFWDILYYTAYQQTDPTLISPANSNCVSLTMTTHDFSLLLFAPPGSGATLTTSQSETGRKAFTQLLSLAHQYGLLVCYEKHSSNQDDDLDDANWSLFNEAGSSIIRHQFELPLYRNISTNQSHTWQLITKPDGYIENGWLAAIGGSQYARHLLNLWLLHPDQHYKNEPDCVQSETQAIAACYTQARLKLPSEFKQPIKPLPLLQRQLKEARINLRGRGLLAGDGQWNSHALHRQPPKGLVLTAAQEARLQPVVAIVAARPEKLISATADETTENDQVTAQLLSYIHKDGLQAARLQLLWETGLLEPAELKAVWRTLPKFWDALQFEQLQWALRQRVKVAAAGRQLSWSAITEMARVNQSKRSQHNNPALFSAAKPLINQGNKDTKGQPGQVQKRVEKLAVPPLGLGPLVKLIDPAFARVCIRAAWFRTGALGSVGARTRLA